MSIHDECIALVHEAESLGWHSGSSAEEYVARYEEIAKEIKTFDIVKFFRELVENVKKW